MKSQVAEQPEPALSAGTAVMEEPMVDFDEPAEDDEVDSDDGEDEAEEGELSGPTPSSSSSSLGLLIHQDLMVRTKSHQELVRGKGGRTLRRIRDTARRDIQSLLGPEYKVLLHLHVKLVKSKNRNWAT